MTKCSFNGESTPARQEAVPVGVGDRVRCGDQVPRRLYGSERQIDQVRNREIAVVRLLAMRAELIQDRLVHLDSGFKVLQRKILVRRMGPAVA